MSVKGGGRYRIYNYVYVLFIYLLYARNLCSHYCGIAPDLYLVRLGPALCKHCIAFGSLQYTDFIYIVCLSLVPPAYVLHDEE